MTPTDKMNYSFLKGALALVNRLAVQLGLNLINPLTAFYPSQSTQFHVETTQEIIRTRHLSRSSVVTSSRDPSSLHRWPCSSPTFLKAAKKFSFHFGNPIHTPFTPSPMLEASLRDDGSAVLTEGL